MFTFFSIIFLLIIALLPVILIGLFIYLKDKEREPKKLLIQLFIYGILACFVTLALTSLAETIFPILSSDAESLNLINLIFYVFIGIALIEEFSKWYFVYILTFNHKDFDHVYDMIVYAVFVALGFAAFENILYVLEGGITVAILRALTAVPGHACDGVFMGYFLSLAKLAKLNNNKKVYYKNLVLSLIVPIILHGIYDYCIYSGEIILLLIFLVFIVMLYIFSLKKVSQLRKVENNLIKCEKYCKNCGIKVSGNYCSNCGTKNV